MLNRVLYLCLDELRYFDLSAKFLQSRNDQVTADLARIHVQEHQLWLELIFFWRQAKRHHTARRVAFLEFLSNLKVDLRFGKWISQELGFVQINYGHLELISSFECSFACVSLRFHHNCDFEAFRLLIFEYLGVSLVILMLENLVSFGIVIWKLESPVIFLFSNQSAPPAILSVQVALQLHVFKAAQ